MRMSHFIVRDAIIPTLTATTKEDAIREMVRSLQAADQLPNADLDDIVRAVFRREQLGSTGIGRNIAIPHSRHASVGQLLGTLALSAPGLPFESIDGEPVHVLVLLISPQDRPGDHLRALENVVQTMRDDGFVRALRECQTREQIWNLINGTRT
ncbi:MAG: PTS sugar transporter subunit IIA [Bacteroidales bacterium]|nr:PTS sugar transporter subunit IIA [Bacteroidales bacterium]